jgi:hypothetical protein
VAYQVSWKILPGLGGVACSEFRAAETSRPDELRGVAVECTAEEAGELLEELETQFSRERFSNAATAFETVKAWVVAWAAARKR